MNDMTPEQPTTRRKGFRTGLRAAAAGAAALAALPAGTAAADDWDDLADVRASARARALEVREEALQRLRGRLAELEERWNDRDLIPDNAGLSAARLERVVDVNGDDFDRGSDPQNRDPLAWGIVRLVRGGPDEDARIHVILDRAAGNATYEVVFLGIRDNRVGLGWVRTNPSGNFDGPARSNQDNTGDPRRLGGGNRVGVFVLTRDGKDQFVAALPTRVT
jgi:hypothetical protein